MDWDDENFRDRDDEGIGYNLRKHVTKNVRGSGPRTGQNVHMRTRISGTSNPSYLNQRSGATRFSNPSRVHHPSRNVSPMKSSFNLTYPHQRRTSGFPRDFRNYRSPTLLPLQNVTSTRTDLNHGRGASGFPGDFRNPLPNPPQPFLQENITSRPFIGLHSQNQSHCYNENKPGHWERDSGEQAPEQFGRAGTEIK